MNPVIGLDVSMGESQVQAFLDKGKPYRKSFSIEHNLEGLGNLLEFLKEVERAAALRNPFQNNLFESQIFNLEILVKIVLQYEEHLSNIANEIDGLAKEIEEYEIFQSIPGIGEKIAATIISEIGEIDRFKDA